MRKELYGFGFSRPEVVVEKLNGRANLLCPERYISFSCAVFQGKGVCPPIIIHHLTLFLSPSVDALNHSFMVSSLDMPQEHMAYAGDNCFSRVLVIRGLVPMVLPPQDSAENE